MSVQSAKKPGEIAIVYLAGLAQGLSLVTFPAASNIFTSEEFHQLTSSEYGSLYLPMIVCAILASGLGGALGRRLGLKRIFLLGLTFNLVSMVVLTLSNQFVGHHGAAYGLLLVATGMLGAGFGATLTPLNIFVVKFFPSKPSTALTSLHATLGFGTALAPLVLTFFISMGWWWGLPVGVGGLFLLLGVTSLGQSLEVEHDGDGPGHEGLSSLLRVMPPRFWVYAGIVVLYGVCETVLGNWATIYLHEDKGLSLSQAGFALATFWAMVTVGRVLVAAVSFWFPSHWIYCALPIMILGAFLGIPMIDGPVGNLVAFGFAGLACSAFLPLSISLAEQEFWKVAEVVSGGLIAAYMLGYGLGSFGVGPLREAFDFSLSAIYTASGALAAAMAVLIYFLRKPTRVDATP